MYYTVHPVDTTPFFIQNLRLQEHFATAAACLQYAQQLPALLAAKGFIAASADTHPARRCRCNRTIVCWRKIHMEQLECQR